MDWRKCSLCLYRSLLQLVNIKSRVAWGMTAPLREKGIFGYDSFALTEIP